MPERQRREHLLHSCNLRRLIDVDVGRELEDELVLAGAVRVEQLRDHRDGALVVLDHAGAETAGRTPLPRAASSSFICSSVSMPGMSISCSMPFIFIFIGPACAFGHGLIPHRAASAAWSTISSVLRVDDARRERLRTDGLGAVRLGAHPRHHDGLRVMADHAAT